MYQPKDFYPDTDCFGNTLRLGTFPRSDVIHTFKYLKQVPEISPVLKSNCKKEKDLQCGFFGGRSVGFYLFCSPAHPKSKHDYKAAFQKIANCIFW